MRNLGPKSRVWLQAIGIENLEQLEALGAAEAYLRVCDAGFKPSLNLLWALQGAILDIPWNDIPLAMKEDLRQRLTDG